MRELQLTDVGGDQGRLSTAPREDMQQPAPTHVLVVEDDPISRDVVYQMLSHFGYQVSTVDGGQAALASVRQVDYDLVFMDYRMIGMDGLETTRRLRAGEGGAAGRTVPIIALTAQAFAEDRDACLAAGMNDFLTKPVVVDSLVSAILQWARRGGHMQAPEQVPARAPSPAAAAPAVFDAAVLSALPMVADGSQPSYRDVVLKMFMQSVPPLLDTIRQAALGGDKSAAQMAAHTLKSSSAAVGALALSACAADAEAHLRAGHQNMAHLPGLFEGEFHRLCHALSLPLPRIGSSESAGQRC